MTFFLFLFILKLFIVMWHTKSKNKLHTNTVCFVYFENGILFDGIAVFMYFYLILTNNKIMNSQT